MPKPQASPLTRPRYHHGDLREALLSAAEAILDEEGVSGLTLRAVARRAGVSHAAPAHHFRDLAGLLAELAARGFTRLGERLAAAQASGRADRSLARIGRGYVGFARENRALFQLMFRSDALDQSSPSLREAATHAFGFLAAGAGSAEGGGQPGLNTAAGMARAWALAHGFAVLSIDGRLGPILQRAEGASEDDLLDAVLFGPGKTGS